VLRSPLVVVVALALGVLTAYAQGFLPHQMSSVANSTGSWALVACGLSLMATSGRLAAIFGSASLLSLLAGYVLGAEVRGYPSSTAMMVFWGAAALIGGPLLGLGSHWVKTGHGLLAAGGVGLVSGMLVGEGVYGVTYIADTTYPPYWWGQILLGVVLLATVAGRHLLGIRAVALSVAVTALVSVAFVVVYSRDLLTLLA